MKRTPEGEAMMDVVWAVGQTFFRLRAAGRKVGAVSSWGGGLWGMMHSLRLEGPQTVPQLARSRPVARQRIQKLANELAAGGLVEFVENPAHRRSKLIRLTAAGDTVYDDLNERVAAMCERLAADFDAGDLATTARTLERIRDALGEAQSPRS